MYTTGVLLVVIAHVQSDAVSVCQSPEEKGPVLVIHQPLFHVSPLAKDLLSAEALSKCKGAVHTFFTRNVHAHILPRACQPMRKQSD